MENKLIGACANTGRVQNLLSSISIFLHKCSCTQSIVLSPQLLLITIISVTHRAFRTIMQHNVRLYQELTAKKTRENVETRKLFIYHFPFFASCYVSLSRQKLPLLSSDTFVLVYSLAPHPWLLVLVSRQLCGRKKSPQEDCSVGEQKATFSAHKTVLPLPS